MNDTSESAESKSAPSSTLEQHHHHEEQICVDKLPVFKTTDFDFESKRFYFDEIYFQNSKIIKM